jgi:SAM-dependent methyltransferase
LSFIQPLTLDNVNRKTYSGKQAVRQYSRATGWLDSGEQIALTYACRKLNNPGILDIGVGGGRTIPLLRNIGQDYVGIDYVEELIEKSKFRYPNTKLYNMDARKLNFPHDNFSLVVFSNNGIDSLDFDDRKKVLLQVCKVLKHDGLFVFSALNHNASLQSHEDKSKNSTKPTQLLKRMIAAPIELYNRIRLRPLEIQNKDTSRRCLNAHFNGLIATFTSIPYQVKQLEECKFKVEEIFTNSGQTLNTDEACLSSSYVYYVARKL